MIPLFGQKFLFGSMRKREVANIMAKGCHSQYATPISQLIGIGQGIQQIPDLIRYVVRIRNDVKDPSCKFHDPERMLQPLVGCARVDKVGKCELVDVAQPLERTGTQYLAFVAVQTDEHVDRVPNLVNTPGHRGIQ